jgi:hypothetical protein
MSKKLFEVHYQESSMNNTVSTVVAEANMEDVIFVGDVHARPELVAAAIEEAAGRPVIFVGDIFDGEGGAQGAKACLDLIRAAGAEMVLGNHELYPIFFGESQEELAAIWSIHYPALLAEDGQAERIWQEWCEIRNLLTEDDIQWLRKRPLWIKGNGWVVAHAKVPNGKMPNKFVNVEPTVDQIELVDNTNPENFWAESYDGRHGMAIVGHTRRSKVPGYKCSWDFVRLLDWDAKKGGPGCLYVHKEDNMRQIPVINTSANKATASEFAMDKKMPTKENVMPFKFHTPHKESKMKLRYLSIVLVIATAYDLPNTIRCTPWKPQRTDLDNVCRNEGSCIQVAAEWLNAMKKLYARTATPQPREKAELEAKAEKKAAKAKVVKAAQAAEHRAMHSRGKEIATWLENRKVCTAPAASRQVRKARSLRAKAKAIANRAVLTAEWVNPNEGNIPSWITSPIGMILPLPASAKGKASVRRLARYQASPWGRAKAEESIARETARAERKAIRMSREEARAAKSAQKATAKATPKKGNAKRAYLADWGRPVPAPVCTKITLLSKKGKQILTSAEAVEYLNAKGYKPAAVEKAKDEKPVVTVAPRVVADATPAHAIKVATAAKADAVIAEFYNGNVKLFTVVALEAMVVGGVYDLAGNLNPDQKAALWAERQTRQVKAEKVNKVKGAEAMFLKANPTYAEFKSRQNTKYTKPLMGQKVATVTQEETK